MKQKRKSVYLSWLLSCLMLSSCAAEAGESPPPEGGDDGVSFEACYGEEWNRMRSELEELRRAQTMQSEIYEKRIELLEAMLSYYEKQTEADRQQSATEETLFTYSIENGIATVTGYTGRERHISVPAMLGGAPVRVIGESAFRNGAFEEVYLPNGLERIDWFAFQGCRALRLVEIPASVSAIGYDAFSYCSNELRVRCPADSYAAGYAISAGIPTV
ncbi:MAG: leucine-rich repeat domain-containing protein [Ruminococcaceae bacterium]|nr:leucine-rich repeat domain-containing protein [Oscillospiraceae bacterium]